MPPTPPEPTATGRGGPAGGLDVRPFRALTYGAHDPVQLARVTSPAYDLVPTAERGRLAAADPHNVVRLILPDVGPAGPSAAEAAASTLHRWVDQGVLRRDAEPAMWRYELAVPGAPTTIGWLAAVAVPPAGSPAVLPHEDTYAPAVEDRRALLIATGTDLEPIVLAHDEQPVIAELTARSGAGRPDLSVTDPDGIAHRLWRVTDPGTLTALRDAFSAVSSVIADGHHRFAAARAALAAADPGVGDDAVLALLTPIGSGGLGLQAIHRVVPDLPLDEALTGAARGFVVAPLQFDGRTPLAAITRWVTVGAPGELLLTDGERAAVLHDASAEVRAAAPADRPNAWRQLDVVLAHAGLIRLLWNRPEDPEHLVIAHSLPEALRTAAERHGVAVVLRPPSAEDVAAIARAGARMPRKSTLFLPKPRTGLMLRPRQP